MKKLLFVFNPLSGRGQVKNSLLYIIDSFVKSGYEVTAHPTQSTLDAFMVIKERGRDFDLVVCCGGDGTLNETVNAVMEIENPPTIGYIPAGTTNDFAYSLHLPREIKKATRMLENAIPFACDLGSLNGKHFTYVAAFGAFTDVSYTTPQQSKNMFGHLAYVLEALFKLQSIKSYKLVIEHDDVVEKDEYMLGLITNSISIGGYKNLSELGIVLDDGLFEVTFIKQPKTAIDFQGLIASVLKKDFNSPYIYAFKTSRLIVKSEAGLEWTIDGEDGGSYKKAEIINHKQAFKILIPNNA